MIFEHHHHNFQLQIGLYVAARTTVVYGVFVVGFSLGQHFAFVANIYREYKQKLEPLKTTNFAK